MDENLLIEQPYQETNTFPEETQPTEVSEAEKEDEIVEELGEEVVQALKKIGDEAYKADESVRYLRTRLYKKLISYMEGNQINFWDEGIGDYRPIGQAGELLNQEEQDLDVEALAKKANVFKANIVSIIAALTAGTPKVKYIPDDAESSADIDTAKQYQLIQKKIEKQKHTNPDQIITRALKIKYTQGLVFGYVYPMEDAKSLGYYSEPITKQLTKDIVSANCVDCGQPLLQEEADKVDASVFQDEQGINCPYCGALTPLIPQLSQIDTEEIIGYNDIPKEKVCIDLYGPTNVYIPFFVTNLAQVPIMELLSEMHFSEAMEKFKFTIAPHIQADIETTNTWTRLPSGYTPDINEIVTVRQRWYRSWSFNMIEDEDIRAELKQKFPEGCYAVFINDEMVDYYEENIDERWITLNDPLSEFLHCVPEGEDMLDLQDMINEMLNLTLETIEHNIPETFVTPQTLNLEKYSQQRARPGNITVANLRPGAPSLQSEFFQTNSSSLSQEHNIFASKLLELSQFITGAMPTIYGGTLKGGSGTAREYESSRAMSLQRLSILWKQIKDFYARLMSLAVPLYVSLMKEDDRFVQDLGNGAFLNVIIEFKKAQGGKIGEIAYETNEQLPVSWAEQRDVYLQLVQMNNPIVGQLLLHPENAGKVRDALGVDIFLPGDNSRQKQLAEIAELIRSGPMPNPMLQQLQASGQIVPPEMLQQIPPMISSIPVDKDVDEHGVEAETCLTWLRSSEGRMVKVINPPAWENVKLHMMEHQMLAQQQMMMQQQQQMAEETESEEVN